MPTSPGPSTLGTKAIVLEYKGAPVSVFVHAICTEVGFEEVPPVFAILPHTT